MAEATTVVLQRWIDRLIGGDETAREQLLSAACERLRRLTHKMFKAEGRLGRWAETDDVFQNAMLRFYGALQEATPATLRHFFRLAALQIRRELIDLARHYFGPAGLGAHHQSLPPREPGDTSRPGAESPDSSQDPGRLAVWGEFHERVGALPDDEREVFDLVWYQGLTHAEAAQLLQVSTKTIQRRWQAACLKLHEVFQGSLPAL
jgi:RNA polymerase sigma-70 factor (ECF subfamily)